MTDLALRAELLAPVTLPRDSGMSIRREHAALTVERGDLRRPVRFDSV